MRRATRLRQYVREIHTRCLEAQRQKGWEGFLNMLLSIRSEISFDINGNPQWGLGVGAMVPPQTTLDEIFAYLRTAEKHCFPPM